MANSDHCGQFFKPDTQPYASILLFKLFQNIFCSKSISSLIQMLPLA